MIKSLNDFVNESMSVADEFEILDEKFFSNFNYTLTGTNIRGNQPASVYTGGKNLPSISMRDAAKALIKDIHKQTNIEIDEEWVRQARRVTDIEERSALADLLIRYFDESFPFGGKGTRVDLVSYEYDRFNNPWGIAYVGGPREAAEYKTKEKFEDVFLEHFRTYINASADRIEVVDFNMERKEASFKFYVPHDRDPAGFMDEIEHDLKYDTLFKIQTSELMDGDEYLFVKVNW